MSDYHDNEWGRPTIDRDALFESMTLQLFQCGLTWKCIFNKRDGFRRAFANFDARSVAEFDETRIEKLLTDTRIVRNRAKIMAVVNNARRIVEMESEKRDSFVDFVWSFSPSHPDERLRVDRTPSGTHMRTDMKDRNYAKRVRSDGAHPTRTCVEMSKALKARGFKFMGPTVVLSFMQAVGLMNHHDKSCHVFERNEKLHAKVTRKRPIRKARGLDEPKITK